MTKLGTILDQVDSGTILLPEFQRGYVWNRDQVRGLMRSLYREYPVGALLLWETDSAATTRGSGYAGSGTKRMLLDGQQRITSLYGVVRGQAPAFFEGDRLAFTGLHFHLDEETFEFYAPAKMRDNPLWIDVTSLFATGLEPYIDRLGGQVDAAKVSTYLIRLNKLTTLLSREFPEEKITGSAVGLNDVVDIFNRVNSGGTKLSKGDLALAKLCAEWPEARAVMRKHLGTWRSAGYAFSLDWLLRNVTAVATGKSQFSALENVAAPEFGDALANAANYIGGFLDVVAGRLGLDHDRVLMGRYALPVVTRYLHLNGGQFADARARDRMLYWYVQSALWGRFAGSTETTLGQDYDTAASTGIDGLIGTLRRWRGGNLTVDEQDFAGMTRGSRFYPLLYLMTRVGGARDFGSGLELRSEMLGHLASLQVHHIFPKALLYQHDYRRGEVNAVANFCFLTQKSNLAIGKGSPERYFAEVRDKHPGTLESQWIPTDEQLWRPDRYRDFLAARRDLLATAANALLDELSSGTSAQSARTLQRITVVTADEPDDARTLQVSSLVQELRAAGCVEPVLDTEIADPETGRVLAMAEASWPDGLQPGQGAPVILELDPDEADLGRLEELGFEVFTSVEALRRRVARRNAEAAGDADSDLEPAPVTPEPAGEVATGARTAFEQAMKNIYGAAKREANYPANYFLGMLAELGGLGTAKKLLATQVVSDGFTTLWERGRLDLTVEALVIRLEYRELFEDEEIERARRRLDQFGYTSS